MSDVHACCDDIIAAKADIRALEQSTAQARIDAQKWRDDHEARNNETFQRFGNEIALNRSAGDALRVEMNRRFDGIEDKLANRLPPWATLALTLCGTTIGILIGVILDLGGKLLKLG
jgi:tetrahydromethanopterin S-methyltransferase subunit G